GDHFAQCMPEAVQREVPAPSLRLRDPVELVSQDVQLARQRRLQHMEFALVNQVVEANVLAGQIAADASHVAIRRWVHDQAGDQFDELVPDGSVGRPIGRERLALAEDLFDDHVKRMTRLGRETLVKWSFRDYPGQARVLFGPRGQQMPSCRELCMDLKPVEVLLRVKQAVWMIDAHAVELPNADP